MKYETTIDPIETVKYAVNISTGRANNNRI